MAKSTSNTGNVWQNLAQHLPQRNYLEPLYQLSKDLLHWNKTHNLTGFNDEHSVAVNLIWDALIINPFLKGSSLLDIGSGAGFPCLVLAVTNPEMQVCSLEPRAKRVSFQRHMKRTLSLDNLDIIEGRAGAQRDPLQGRKFHNITIKAVGALNFSLELAKPYLLEQGQVLMPRGNNSRAIPNQLLSQHNYALPPPGGQRRLLIYCDPGS